MKKINMTEASTIVGGTTTCVNSFELNLVGNATVCNAVKTCTDKNGVVTKTFTAAAIINCGSVG
ncbi:MULTISPECIES: DUF4762 family protein [Rahnella]|jgi:hypothetical protein|uniref:DUF4762 domain-containing protein n=3 Tax=Rahnella TaxID=34037 RepID=A0A6M2AYY2_9GAMM|nr:MULTISPECIES: DUF4762 family protein [Rahnella]KAB8308825.1 DUF4762 domain-containing protein [Rouxiella chamberiensis]AVF34818.1 DUF4762 domain-containing protein [Rahnella sikkimica]MBF7980224.1 DUF4762 family protein [Rahnella laticis]MBF8000517.1 DUF4762 family protein [Rahnella sp. LAC-M12]MBU9819579.1 DUF4762 family protein [Rahnella sp. BCC 1045]